MRRFTIFGSRGTGDGDESNNTNNTGNSNSLDQFESGSLPSTPGETGAGRALFRNFPKSADSTRIVIGAPTGTPIPSHATEIAHDTDAPQMPRLNSSAGGSGFTGWASGFRSQNQLSHSSYLTLSDAKMERIVALSSRKFGDGVQNIVVSAKTKQQDGGSGEWKKELLDLLGAGPDEEVNKQSHIDILLANSQCENFVLRCLENELPPNLIHCLRLLRVLELQHANNTIEMVKTQQSSNVSGFISPAVPSSNENPETEENDTMQIRPRSERATLKVSKLLCLLCVDTTVGEQLRPHLFGLLALSGASYPPSGIHVAKAASEVIITFAENCLSRQLVWFIHDRKMMVHMTDDVKELSGMLTESSNGNIKSSDDPVQQSVPLGLTGARAEQAGLMVIALTTVIKLVAASMKFETIELVKDFESAGGYDVLQYAIYQSSGENGKKMMELLPLLACCPNEFLADDEAGLLKLACNVRVFDLLGDLLMRANPLLRAWERKNVSETGTRTGESIHETDAVDETDTNAALEVESDEGDNLDLANPGSLKDLAILSVVTSAKLRASNSREDEPNEEDIVFRFDLSHELITITLQLIADHPNNYEILEERLHILSYFLLALPCYEDENLKSFILKTLEFVLTGVGIANEVTPVNACVEIFSALIQTLLKDDLAIPEAEATTIALDHVRVVELLVTDANRVVNTLEKLLQFDQRVARLMVESGILTTSLDTLLNVIHNFTSERQGKLASTDLLLPPLETPLNNSFGIVCRVLKLLVAYHPLNTVAQFSAAVAGASFPGKTIVDSKDTREKSNLHSLLRLSVSEMGIEDTKEACLVFETYMIATQSVEGFNEDMKFVLSLFKDCQEFFEIASASEDLQQIEKILAGLLQRETAILQVLRSILESKLDARDSFRICGGFEAMTTLIVSLKAAFNATFSSATLNVAIATIQMCFLVLDGAVGVKSKNQRNSTDVSPLVIHADVTVDYISSRLTMGSSSANNRMFLRQIGFYIDFAAALASTGLLNFENSMSMVLDCCFAHMDPMFKLEADSAEVLSIANPDGIRLLLALCIFIPNVTEMNALSLRILQRLMCLCDEEKKYSTLPQLATCGICHSIVSPKEFGTILQDRDHFMSTKLQELLRKLAAFNMSYTDFVSILRNVAGPVLIKEGSSDCRIRLPVISASIRRAHNISLKLTSEQSDGFLRRDIDLSQRLQLLCEIAKNGDSVSRIKLGGDSVNTIAVLMHQVRLEDRVRASAEEGRLRFLEVDSIDASAVLFDGNQQLQLPLNQSGEKMWSPVSSTGFSYCIWLRHEVSVGTINAGNLYILDLYHIAQGTATSPPPAGPTYLAVWYDFQNQRFNVISSASYRGEPTCFPVSPISPFVWHHILVTYSPPKRTMMARKSVVCIYVDGRPLEAEVKVDSANLPPNSRMIIGAPNPAFAVSGVVRGVIPKWELGPALLLATILLDLDATAIYSYGPDFPCLLWGDRPQRLSLAATGTSLFAMLARAGEPGSVANALKRREISKLEAAGYSSMSHTQKDDLSTLNLLCSIPPDCVVFGFHGSTTISKLRNENKIEERRLAKERLVNMARLNHGSETVSTDAMVYGKGTICSPFSFKDSLRFVGGPVVLLPIVNAANSPRTLAFSLQLIRLACQGHRPNLEMMQASGGYRMLSVLLQGKGQLDESCLDQCLSFAIYGFDPDPSQLGSSIEGQPLMPGTDFLFSNYKHWVFSDIDAMNHLLMNHQVWDLRNYGPNVPLRLLTILNLLVDHKALHRTFNARRLHQVGIVRWALHLAIEAAELYTLGHLQHIHHPDAAKTSSNVWCSEPPLVDDVAVGADPGNPFLFDCKSLLRRVLTFMLTPGDLESLVEAIVYTVFISGTGVNSGNLAKETPPTSEDRMLPGPTMRLHLVRLLEELIVDGVNEIVASSRSEELFQHHIGGVASLNQPYFTSANIAGRSIDGTQHPKHHQAQSFLKAFASYLTPVWFATVLEGCREEASAAALFRLMILLLQGSTAFEASFRVCGAFSPFVLSIPKFSTSPNITISMLSQLLHVPILHLHALPQLNAEQLCEVFDAESDDTALSYCDVSSDPSTGIFALIVECLGRNVHLISNDGDSSGKAATANQAIVKLLLHRHSLSHAFRHYCCSPGFLEPLSQALCLVYDERITAIRSLRFRRQSLLADIPKGLTPTERYVGANDDPDSTGVGIVRLLRMVIKHCLTSGPRAVVNINAVFRSFPIHASPRQVEAFHLILIEHCCSVIEGILQDGNAVSLGNCIGVCSVFLDQILGGFFTAEAALKAANSSVAILTKLLKFEERAMYSLDNNEHSLLTLNAAHISNLVCVAALRMSLPFDSEDRGDEDLQSEVLQTIDNSISSLWLLPSRDRKSNWKVPIGKFTRPLPNTKLYNLWESVSISRCQEDYEALYPEPGESDSVDAFAIAPLLSLLYRMLTESRDDVRSLAISVLVALLQYRANVLSNLLVVEIEKGDSLETIDIISRGGFRALLAAHEAAAINDKSNALSVKRKYSSFFEWIERNHQEVELVFNEIERKASEIFPHLENPTISQPEAVLNEQKIMLVQLTTQANDRTMLGSLERAELSLICSERTMSNHTKWKRQGFDDLAFGAMKWKILLRQLKGSSSIWEGGPRFEDKHQLISLKNRVARMQNSIFHGEAEADDDVELVRRWKLDLTEGYERQRRRLLPNYEFHGLYNLDEDTEHELLDIHNVPDIIPNTDVADQVQELLNGSTDFFVGGEQVVATAEFLRDLKVKKANKDDRDDEEFDETEIDEDGLTVATTLTFASNAENNAIQSEAVDSTRKNVDISDDGRVSGGEVSADEKDSSSYELITGLLQAGDWPEKSYNIQRCNGLEVTQALLLWCKNAIYVIDGFEQTGGGGMEGRITRVEREHSSFYISLRPKDFAVRVEEKTDEELAAGTERTTSNSQRYTSETLKSKASNSDATSEVIYEHRSQRILLSDLYAVYRRRYQLQQNALEFYDVHRNATLIAFEGEADREEVLSKVLQSEIPNSIFSSSYGTFINYSKFMRNLKQKIITRWQNGKMSNFDFLMQMNSFAGRSFNDLTQYPVFPWVLADYDSEEIDLNDSKVYRDFSKPMGAIGEDRAEQFRERYEALASTDFSENDPPPFHYGTHYSCAAYVLYYLMRLEPFSRLALALQGGKFDFADRLFHDVGRSWKSASAENLQDVRELIPEFFYLPDFLLNTNNFDFGETQRGKSVHDVTLPKWAKNDPQRFIRINRQALESDYVSKNLHHWVDLIFGYKQQGDAAVESLNTFVHVTYEGVVDLDSMEDPTQRLSTIAQIQNFGQTPTMLEKSPFPQRNVLSSLKDGLIEFSSLIHLAALSPPFCVAGAAHRVDMMYVQNDQCRLIPGQTNTSVGDISMSKGQIIAVPKMCALIVPSKKYYRFGGVNNGVSVHAAAITARFREVNKLLSIHDDLHSSPILVARPSRNGSWLVTGAADSTLRVWYYDDCDLQLRATLCGHGGSQIRCLDVSTECGVIVSGCSGGKVHLWDLRTLTFVRSLRLTNFADPVLSVSINNKNGNIVTLFESCLSIFDVNGCLLACQGSFESNPPTVAISTDCPEWMEKGVAAITGHKSGAVCLWSIDYDSRMLVLRHGLEANPHSSPITCIEATGGERQDTLVIGDSSGKISVFKTVQLDQYNSTELAKVVDELKVLTSGR